MKKITITLAALFFVSNICLAQDLDKKSTVKELRDVQHQENAELRQKEHEENMAFLRARLAGNAKLTPAERDELIGLFENQYKEKISFRDKQHSENVASFEKIANDPGLTMEQKKEAIKEHISAQRQTAKAFYEQQRAEKKTKMQKMRP